MMMQTIQSFFSFWKQKMSNPYMVKHLILSLRDSYNKKYSSLLDVIAIIPHDTVRRRSSEALSCRIDTL